MSSVCTRPNQEGKGRHEERGDPQNGEGTPPPTKWRCEESKDCDLASIPDMVGREGGRMSGLEWTGPRLSMPHASPLHPLTSAACSLQASHSRQWGKPTVP